MPMINEKDRLHLTEHFKALAHPVRLVFFTQDHECEYCKTTREILEELAALSGQITLEVHDFVKDAELAKGYGVDKIPATLLLGDRDYGIRFYGVPAGYEFTTLVEDILDVGRREPRLSEEVKREVAKIDKLVHLQVLISPTCPACPVAVRAAHRLAMASEFVRADMVEVSEFPMLAVRYHVHGVPQTVINETQSLIGAFPEPNLVKEILRVLQEEKKNEAVSEKKLEKMRQKLEQKHAKERKALEKLQKKLEKKQQKAKK